MRNETLIEKVASIIQIGHIKALTSEEIAINVIDYLNYNQIMQDLP